MRTERLLELLERIHPLSQPFKDALDKELQSVSYPKNHFLVQMHSTAHHAYFMEKGFAAGYYFVERGRVVTSFFQAGEIVLSPQSFFEQSQSDEVIQVTIDSDLLCISYASVNKLFEEFPEANFLARAITAQFHSRSNERMVDLHTLSASARYEKLVTRYPRIELHASQDLIASYLNITPQSLSRLRHNRNQGLT